MAEWLKAHAWKACVGETLPRVRIPLSPPSVARRSASFGWQTRRADRLAKDVHRSAEREGRPRQRTERASVGKARHRATRAAALVATWPKSPSLSAIVL